MEFFPADACEARPVAYDGVYRSEIPHPESSHKHMLTVSSRLDLAVRCSEDATIFFHQGEMKDESRMVSIKVKKSQLSTTEIAYQGADSSFIPTVELTPSLPSSPFWDEQRESTWNPRRPYYMPDLSSPEMVVEDEWIISMDDFFANGTKGVSINQVTWDPKSAIREFDLDQLVEWRLLNTQTHPYHGK
jgi:FtsP/CotA-like multicopper oxidase with cupredoxin domain